MESNEVIDTRLGTRGSKPSVVESFSIQGLHGYKELSFSSPYAATVLIAKNGSGKTTLVGALDAFLKAQFSRLIELPFTTLRCKLRGIDEVIEISHEDLTPLSVVPIEGEFINVARRFAIEPVLLFDFLENDYLRSRDELREYGSNEVFDKIVQKTGYIYAEARKVCDKAVDALNARSPKLDSIRSKIQTALGDTEIVYLPTYRRIELSIPGDSDDDRRHIRKRKSVHSRLGLSRRGVFNGDIQFGLADISDRLAALNQEILFNSNNGYRQISANIINELLDGSFDREGEGTSDLPDKESLQIFFSRLREGSRVAHGPLAIPNIDKLYDSSAIGRESNRFLLYFLRKLNTVMDATRDIEAKVEEFIRNCNRYLSSVDATTGLSVGEAVADDDKFLKLDRKNLRVDVWSVGAGRSMSLDSLSSGEKQMISLFARLYLYGKQKLILIDEPELSLSIDWQRRILSDVVGADSCVQVIAITHSPFVFDNELEPYAMALKVAITPVVGPQVEAETEEGANDL